MCIDYIHECMIVYIDTIIIYHIYNVDLIGYCYDCKLQYTYTSAAKWLIDYIYLFNSVLPL